MATENSIQVDEARKALATSEAQAIDIRDKGDWLEAHIPGSLHAAGEQFDIQIDELSDEQAVIVIGDDDDRCAEVVDTLSERGHEARVLKGGMKAWKDANYTIQPSEDPELGGDFDPAEGEGEPAG